MWTRSIGINGARELDELRVEWERHASIQGETILQFADFQIVDLDVKAHHLVGRLSLLDPFLQVAEPIYGKRAIAE